MTVTRLALLYAASGLVELLQIHCPAFIVQELGVSLGSILSFVDNSVAYNTEDSTSRSFSSTPESGMLPALLQFLGTRTHTPIDLHVYRVRLGIITSRTFLPDHFVL